MKNSEDKILENFEGITDILSLVERAEKLFNKKDYLLYSGKSETISFKFLYEFIIKFSVFLNEKGLKRGSKILVVLNNSPLLLLLFYAIIGSKRIFIPLNPKSGKKELEYIIDEVEPETIIYDKTVDIDVSNINKSIIIENEDDFIDNISQKKILIESEAKEIKNYTDSIAEIIFTSGTTGKPKGVVLTHKNLIADSYGIFKEFSFTKNEVFMTVTPLFHNSGQVPTSLTALWSGASNLVIRPEVALIKFWYFVDKYNIDWTFVTPTFISFFLLNNTNLKLRKKESYNKTMKGIFCGGAKLSPTLMNKFESEFNIPLYEAYGLTETTSFATCVKRKIEYRKENSAGTPLLTNTIEIRDSDKRLKPYEIGEIVIKGSNVFKEYLNMKDLTNEKKKNGWFYSGDLGYLDKSNNLFVLDRKDSMIIIGGENVYPSEVENLLSKLIGAENIILSSIKDFLHGNSLVLIYEKNDNTKPDFKVWNDVFKEHLSNFKIPKRIIEINDLGLKKIPKSEGGKILRKKIEEILERKTENERKNL